MSRFLVTVRLPRNPLHNPHQKQVGMCPVTGLICTDITGEHHSLLVEAESFAAAKIGLVDFEGRVITHITRIESVN